MVVVVINTKIQLLFYAVIWYMTLLAKILKQLPFDDF